MAAKPRNRLQAELDGDGADVVLDHEVQQQLKATRLHQARLARGCGERQYRRSAKRSELAGPATWVLERDEWEHMKGRKTRNPCTWWSGCQEEGEIERADNGHG